MNGPGPWIVLLGSAAAFFVLQAVYWWFVSVRSAERKLLAQRLGSADAVESEADELLRKGARDGQGYLGTLAIYTTVARRLAQAGDTGGVPAFFTRCAVFGLAGFAGVVALTQDVLLALVTSGVFACLPWVGLVGRVKKRLTRIEEQLPEALEVMAISLRAGQSLAQTIRVTSSEIQSPLGDEFRRIAEEVELGRPIDESLLAMAQRVDGARSVRQFVVAVLVLRQTGGNLIEVLETIIDTMRQQSAYERKLMAMTAEGRSSAMILALLPPAFTLLIFIGDRKYLSQLTNSSMGHSILIIAGVMYLLGVVWVRRLVNPKG
jgi:tight adherence protein B